jgi:hypothetical protein
MRRRSAGPGAHSVRTGADSGRPAAGAAGALEAVEKVLTGQESDESDEVGRNIALGPVLPVPAPGSWAGC